MFPSCHFRGGDGSLPTRVAAVRAVLREFENVRPRQRPWDVLYEDQRNAQRVSITRRVKGKLMLLVEGVAFAVGLMMVAGSAYYMLREAKREAERSQ